MRNAIGRFAKRRACRLRSAFKLIDNNTTTLESPSMSKHNKFPPKLVIYGVGFVGQELVRIASRKNWEIVAAFNRKGDKVGQDIGRLAGLEKDLGVLVQDCEEADYDAINADVALNTSCNALADNMVCYERFLSRGINVLCHAGEAYNPFWSNKECAEKIDALAKRNGVSFSGSGIWDMTRFWAGVLKILISLSFM